MEIYKFITDNEGLQCSLHFTEKDLAEAVRGFLNGALEYDQPEGVEKFPLGTPLSEMREYCEKVGLGDSAAVWEHQIIRSPEDDKLARCYDALQKCIAAIDLHDQFGDDSDARDEAEEEAVNSAKNALPDPGPQKSYAVIGRFAFDLEDSCEICWADSRDQAVQIFNERMKDADPDNANELTVTQILESYAQINDFS